MWVVEIGVWSFPACGLCGTVFLEAQARATVWAWHTNNDGQNFQSIDKHSERRNNGILDRVISFGYRQKMVKCALLVRRDAAEVCPGRHTKILMVRSRLLV